MVSRSFNIIKSNNNNKDKKGHIAAAKAIHKKYAPKVHEQAKKIRAAMARLMELEDEISGEPTLQDVDYSIKSAYAYFDIHCDKDSVGADEGGVSFEAALDRIADVSRDSAPKEDGYDSSGDDEGGEEDEEEGNEEEVVEIEDDD